MHLKSILNSALKDVENKLVISNGKIETLLADIDNLNDEQKSILQSQIYQRKFQQHLKSQLNIMLKDLEINQYDTISEYLKNSYHNGYIGSMYTLNMVGIPLALPIDPYLVYRATTIDSKIKHGLYKNLVDKVDEFKKRIAGNISRGIASASSYQEIARNIRNGTKVTINQSMRIVRTEGNRIYNAAALDCGKGAKERGSDLVKQWDSTIDMKTRSTHRELDGQIKELEEKFHNSNGEADAPGHFGIAGEDINCRCAVLIKPRWDIDSSFTKMNNITGEIEEFENVKDYQDFKKKYWDVVDKSSNEKAEKKTSEKTKPEPQKTNNNSKFYTKSELEKMPLEELRRNTKELAEKYYRSGKSGISFGDADIKNVVESMSAGASRTSLTKDYISMKKRLEMVDNSAQSDIIKVTKNAVGKEVEIVNRSELHDKPNAITQYVNKKGGIDRNYYDENGNQKLQISNHDHGHKKESKFGKHGEHAHDYVLDEQGIPRHGEARELNDIEKIENGDII